MKITEKIVCDFIENGVIKQEEYALYYYCFDVVFSQLFFCIVLLSISLILHQVEVTIAYYIGFSVIRYTSGGYHAKSQRRCFWLSILNYMFCLGLINIIPRTMYPGFLFGTLLIDFFLIWKFAPVDHPNKRFSLQEVYCYRKRSRVAISGIMLSIFFLWKLMPLFSLAFVVGCMSATISVVVAKKQ